MIFSNRKYLKTNYRFYYTYLRLTARCAFCNTNMKYSNCKCTLLRTISSEIHFKCWQGFIVCKIVSLLNIAILVVCKYIQCIQLELWILKDIIKLSNFVCDVCYTIVPNWTPFYVQYYSYMVSVFEKFTIIHSI